MTGRAVIALALLAGLRAAQAQASTCEAAARHAEIRAGLPDGLLSAIGRIESGVSPSATWSVNANDGAPGVRFDNEADAENHVARLLEGGDDVVDLGCFQIDIHYHPEAFARWQNAFDPDANADAAARILRGLHDRTGDWNRAVSLYHSADPARGQPYLRSWLAAWSGHSPGAPAWSSIGLFAPDPHQPVATVAASWPTVIGPHGPPVSGRGHLPRIVMP